MEYFCFLCSVDVYIIYPKIKHIFRKIKNKNNNSTQLNSNFQWKAPTLGTNFGVVLIMIWIDVSVGTSNLFFSFTLRNSILLVKIIIQTYIITLHAFSLDTCPSTYGGDLSRVHEHRELRLRENCRILSCLHALFLFFL